MNNTLSAPSAARLHHEPRVPGTRLTAASRSASGAISQRELRSLLSTQRCFEDMLSVFAQNASVEPGPLGLNPVALRMRVPNVIVERNETLAQPCRVAHVNKPAEKIGQNDLSTLQAAERLLVLIRQRMLDRVRSGLPIEPGPLTLDVAVVQEPVFASVIAR